MTTRYINIFTLTTLVLLTACSEAIEVQQPQMQPGAQPGTEVREQVHITFEASLEGASAVPTTRVAYTQGAGQLNRTWAASETLGVYIKHTDGTITYAGSISSTGETTDVTRTFSGDVSRLQSGETYVYMHPSLAGTKDAATTATINYTSQSGDLGSTAHLSNLIPMVWHDGNSVADMQGYVLRLVLTFNQDPGNINTIALQTMSMGDAGTTEDRVFPAAFNTANLAKAINSTLDTPKTRGTTLNTDYTGTITLTTSGSATNNGDGTYTAEAYLASAAIHNLDVFRSKYNVKVTAASGTYYSDYKSFPGQTTANATDGLAMLQNGKSYKLTAKMSKGYAPTIISEQYKVNSLLGMWNQYGKAYDPQGLVASDASQWPTALQTVIGDASKQTSIKARITSSNTSGTPNWLGPAAGSLYATGHADDLKQENVTFNNIQITQDTEVFFTIVSEFGWNQNLLGYYYYPTASEGSVNANSITKNIIFADVSKPGHEPFNSSGQAKNNVGRNEDAPIQEFETVKLLYTDENGYTSSTFPAGTTIGFFMMIDPEANIIEQGSAGYNPRTYDLMRWNQWRLFTNSAWNAHNTLANGAVVNWPSTGYTNSNFFASGDVCSNESGTKIPGLAIYGVKDNGINNNNYAYGAMIFMVSTSVPAAMQTQNRASFNIGSGSLVIAKPEP